jgi:hypothetical protein
MTELLLTFCGGVNFIAMAFLPGTLHPKPRQCAGVLERISRNRNVQSIGMCVVIN